MAITRSQQAKQMLQDGGMLVQPGFGGARQGYRGDAAAAAGAPGTADAGPGGDPGEGPAGNTGPDGREGRIGGQYDSPEGRSVADRGEAERNVNAMLAGLRRSISPTLAERTRDFLDRFGPDFVDDDDDEVRGGPDVLGPLGRNMSGGIMNPAAVQPQQTMDLNRIAYRFMADGGFLEDTDEARQAYGLGSIVRKITKPIKKVVKGVAKGVKKVAKSPIGRIALAVAAPYALGPAMAPYMASLSATQQAMLLSAATTGITQVASGEDLDFKDIALSAALSGGISKAFPAGTSTGVDGKAFAANRASPGLDPSTLAGRARVASDVTPKNTSFLRDSFMGTRGKGITEAIKSAPKDTGLFSALTKNLGKIGDSKVLQFAKDNPFLTITGLSGLAGLMAKKQEDEKFTEMDRGPGIDIDAIRRRPFDYLAPRFAGSEFDFYGTSAAEGGRIGYDEAGAVLSKEQIKKVLEDPLFKGFKTMYSVDPDMAKENKAYKKKFDIFKQVYEQKFQEGGKAEPVAKKVMPLLDMGGKEMDLREDGGFVPIGRMEKADDVPARLSKNEFVFTADAVRNAGDGDVDKGAEVMYNMMKNLEAGGDVSEESQGLQGARRMFQTSQRLEEVL